MLRGRAGTGATGRLSVRRCVEALSALDRGPCSAGAAATLTAGEEISRVVAGCDGADCGAIDGEILSGTFAGGSPCVVKGAGRLGRRAVGGVRGLELGLMDCGCCLECSTLFLRFISEHGLHALIISTELHDLSISTCSTKVSITGLAPGASCRHNPRTC